MEKQESYRLEEIFQLAEDNKIELPTVQRGFVWRPYQIENLWDSLLRGYPVGAFIFSKKEGVLNLLDGQQRATSIYLAFCDPGIESRNATFKATKENFRIFIDLGKSDPSDNRRYIFRVITKSHPWGYQRRFNQGTLPAHQINAACSCYKLTNGNYLETPLENFWPHDAIMPVPFSFFLHGESPEQVKSKIKAWKDSVNYDAPESADLFTVEQIWHDTQEMLKNFRIPAIYLDINSVVAKSSDTYSSVETEDNDGRDESNDSALIEDQGTDEIENLFIRLNSGGTPLRGEELNYSILKANIPVALQRKLEEACAGMFSPARFVTLAFRLFQHSRADGDKSDALSMRIKAKQFQTAIRSNKDAFISYLEWIFEEEKIDRLRKLISYSPENIYGLPQFIASSLANSAPEVMFILLYRLWIMKDKFEFGTDRHRRMLGIVTMFLWFGRGTGGRDHAKLLVNVSKNLSEPDTEKFWSRSLVTVAGKMDERTGTYALIKPVRKQHLHEKTPKNSNWNYAGIDWFANNKEEEDAPFIYNILYNRDLLLYAQREALHIWFAGIDYSLLEDNNVPYDWDHIFPNNWVYGKWYIKDELKQWYNTIGNFRAWPYSLNRADQDNSLNEKLSINDEESFRQDICVRIGRNANAVNFDPDILCKWSVCENDWKEIGYSSMKDEEIAKDTIKRIRDRALSIYEEWYRRLKISDLI